MKKPEALAQLLEDLRDEHIASDVEILKTSEAIIYPEEDVEDDDGIKLTGEECRILFATPATVERLIESLDNSNATISLFDLKLSADILDALERSFRAVDEG